MSTPHDPENRSVPPQPPTAPQPAPHPAPHAAPPQPAPASPPETGATLPQQQLPIDRSTLPPFNIMAIIAFVGAFIVPVVGIVCGHITLAEYRKGLPERGREYALAGTILGYIFTAIWLALAILWVVFAFTHVGHGSGIRQGGGSFQPFGGGNGGGGGGRSFPFPTSPATPGS